MAQTEIVPINELHHALPIIRLCVLLLPSYKLFKVSPEFFQFIFRLQSPLPIVPFTKFDKVNWIDQTSDDVKVSSKKRIL